MSRLMCAVALFVAALVCSPVQAESIARMLRDTGLVQQDIDLMTEEAASLYKSTGKQIGDATEWENANTGARGAVEIVGIERNCVVLRHIFQTSKRSQQQINFRRCQTADGTWQLS
ncbi:RT0821/Lpp0805 family surface protein [Pseudohalocynthiibacter aestuariivivens]|uniref:RT0821/Lpp0805 family surface protein n=1 Tax=Pseudohalocynthiibacter aestuariivivens TaxID=1591409 RepID=A0ABV5JCN6_9RHOB|nr:RT0821/Lpp0805 family surface protein [Pseudohalocynthiibacter aestuariivivens]MBS9718843.1 hypothetical protein [Pseudohalocynthiibacter aestuariivivens]